MSELLPCPFCGGKARIYMNDSDLDNIMWYCMCTNDRGCNVMPITLDQYSKEEAAEAWNTRHVETCTIGDYKDPDYGYTHDAMWNDEWFVPSGRCSGCGEYIPVWNYCPSCGRKVEG